MKNIQASLSKLSFLLVFLSSVAFSQQTINVREFFVEAESFFLFEEYSDALPLYQRILSVDPENYNIIYKVGICYLNDPYQKEKSIKYLLDASNHISTAYKPNTIKETMAPPEALYYLGQAYRATRQLDKAIESYTKFKAIADPAEFEFAIIDSEIASCQVAKQMIKSSVYAKRFSVGEPINSRFADINPILSGDGRSLIFNRKLQFYDAVFISTLDSAGRWSEPYNLTPDFGLDGNSYVTGISFNGDEIFVYRSDNFDGNIYSSKRIGIHWQTLGKLNENINTKYWESSASPSPDGTQLYFSSNRKDGSGGLDIYRSTKGSDGQWRVPVNLGPTVNSPFNDDAPFLSPDGNLLFFTSLGHDGMGGYDIFISAKTGDNKWAKPVNIGYPVNSTGDEMMFCPVNKDEITGIYAYFDQNTSYGLKDIYWTEVYNSILPRQFNLKGKVNLPAGLDAGAAITATLVDDATGKIVAQVPVDSTGAFSLAATQGSYQLVIDGQGINTVSTPVVLDVASEKSFVELGLITATAASKGEVFATTNSKPELEVVGGNNIVATTAPVAIALKVEKGSDLTAEHFVNGELVNSEKFYLAKDEFTYNFTPEPGENVIVFTITDKQGNTSQQKVVVNYSPEVVAPLSDASVTEKPTALPEVALISSAAGLQAYLLSLGDTDYDSKAALYEMLIANADENGYSVENVNELFAIMLTQRNKEEYLSKYNVTSPFTNLQLADSVIDPLKMPLAVSLTTLQTFPASSNEIHEGLLRLMPFNSSSDKEFDYLLSFSDSVFAPGSYSIPASDAEAWSMLQKMDGAENASLTLNLASTTQEMNYYYHNLLASSDGKMLDMLKDIDFKANNLVNSIDLVNHLMKIAPHNGIGMSELINTLEKAQNQQNKNLIDFRNALANSATGELKSTIEELDLEANGIYTYEDLLNVLLAKSKTEGYSASEVYDLILSMLEFATVEEFAAAMKAMSNGQLDEVFKSLDLKQFSTPVELIQYLIAHSGEYDYTESDINNLLLRMLLEKGISNYLETEQEKISEKLIMRRRMITTIILVNGLIVIFLILFARRRKKKKDSVQNGK